MVTQIGGHIAGSRPPNYGSRIAFSSLKEFCPFFSRRLASKCACARYIRRSPQLVSHEKYKLKHVQRIESGTSTLVVFEVNTTNTPWRCCIAAAAAATAAVNVTAAAAAAAVAAAVHRLGGLGLLWRKNTREASCARLCLLRTWILRRERPVGHIATFFNQRKNATLGWWWRWRWRECLNTDLPVVYGSSSSSSTTTVYVMVYRTVRYDRRVFVQYHVLLTRVIQQSVD